MLYNSYGFLLFFIALFCCYWFLSFRSHQVQNIFLLLGSYFFYGSFDWRFTLLLFFISISSYFIAIRIAASSTKQKKKRWLWSGILIDLSTLVYFKYAAFFADGFIRLFSSLGFQSDPVTLHIILPVGISFYIFLSLSYKIDVYRGQMLATRKVTDLLLSLSFFPIILAGPIQRPATLLPQISKPRVFDYTFASEGLRMILWGLVMKVVVADTCMVAADDIFADYKSFHGSTLLAGGFFYTMQIYGDFGGYSLLAAGIARLFGFQLMYNFSYPYFARNIKEFWQRWHISLTSWLRDYLYLPLAFSLSRKIKSSSILLIPSDHFIYIVAITITWLVTGLWHGAQNTFIIWGLLNGLLLIMHQTLRKPERSMRRYLKINRQNKVLTMAGIISTFMMVLLLLIIFRSDDLNQATAIFFRIFSMSLLTIPQVLPFGTFLIVVIFLMAEWVSRDRPFPLSDFHLRLKLPVRWAVYYSLALMVFLLNTGDKKFIYMQF